MHIVDKLREDHERLAALFQRIHQSTDGSAERRGSLAGAVGRTFSTHVAFKEAVFYPALREGTDEAGQDITRMVGEAVSEHHEAEDRLSRLQDLDPASAEFTAEIRALEAMVREQAQREEDQIFPLALRVIGSDEAEEMSERHDAMARQHV